MKKANVLIVGSGVAALQLARKLRKNMNVMILTKSHVLNGNSYKAQGGVAASISHYDNWEKHYRDTLKAGRYHNNPEAVAEMTKAAPELIKEMLEEGCSFDTDENGELLLGMEGAHSEKRIVHGGGDATGKRIMDFLNKRLSGITIIENITVFDLIMKGRRCIGVKGKYPDNRTEHFYGDHIVLATGGLGQIYSLTSSAETVTGDGLAIAYRAGVELADMEFIQFHPTLLYVNRQAVGLVSEAVRGEGGILVTDSGKKIMEGVHPLKDLAPRYVVAQEIYNHMRNGETIYLDITAIRDFEMRFPTVSQLCYEHGVDVRKGRIPVAPGCHFLMGGVKTDLNGRTNIEGLYAIGEVACTGIHGANRLASNSLLEGLFFGKNLADWLNTRYSKSKITPLLPFKENIRCDRAVKLPDASELRNMMMDNVGIVRSEKCLREQKRWLEQFGVERWMEDNLEDVPYDQLQIIFMLITSWLVTTSALKRTESRGGHFRSDFPEEDDKQWLGKQIIHKKKFNEDEGHEHIETPIAT